MSHPLLIPSILMGKHNTHHPSDRAQPKKATQGATHDGGSFSVLSKALGRRRGSNPPPPAQPAQGPSAPVQAHDPPRPVRTRVPAVTSKARTTAPENDKSRASRRKYPSTMRQRPH